MNYRIAKEGRNGWVVRKHQPPNFWRPVYYAASGDAAWDYVKQLMDREERNAHQ